MALYSHDYEIRTRGIKVSGNLGMKPNQTFSTTTRDNTSSLTATQVTAIATFLTAVNTLKTALGELGSIKVLPTGTQDLNKV